MTEPTTHRARYFDGNTALAHDVRVVRSAEALTILGADGALLAAWPLGETRLAGDIREDAAVMLTSAAAPNARLVLDDPAAHDAFMDLAPALARRGARRGAGFWIGWTAAAAAVVAMVWLAVDRLPGLVAPLVPAAWERWLGDQVLEAFAGDDRLCADGPGQAALDRLAQRMSVAAGLDQPVVIKVIDIDMVNAFALPGGRIGFFRGLIDSADDPDEVAGVLAHEMAHVMHHDSTEGMIRALGLSTVLQVLLGGSASGAENAAGMANMLLALSYGREAESAADATALVILTGDGINADGLNRFFLKLEKMGDLGGVIPSWLSTHPPTSERIRATAGAAGPGSTDSTATSPAMSPADWLMLKGICGG